MFCVSGSRTFSLTKPSKCVKKKVQSLVVSMLSLDDDEDEESDSGGENIEMDADMQCIMERSEVDRYLQLPQLDHITDNGGDVEILKW